MAKDAKAQGRIIAGLDIGTTKVACAIGRFDDGQLNIIGVGTAPNSGMRHGVVVHIDSTSEAIRKAKDEAELMAGIRADHVWLSVGGQHVQSFASSGMIAIRNKEVQKEDIDRVIEAAKAVCRDCAAREECLEYSLATNQDSGIWGGTSEEERRILRRKYQAAQRSA